MLRNVKFLPALLVLALVLLAACGPKEGGEVPAPDTETEFVFTRDSFPKLDGSTSTAPLARAMCAVLLGEKLEQVDNLVDFSRTTQSYRNLMAGEAALVMAAEPAPEVLSQLEEGDGWLLTPFATDALVFVVNENNPVDSLTTEEIQKIYTGEITNWSQVGGEDLDIVAFQRNKEAGSQTMFEKLVMDGQPLMDPPASWLSDSMLGLLEGVREYDNSPAAIGYTVYYYANDMAMAQGLKVLAVDGVEPSPESIQKEAYPFRNPYFAAIARDEPEDSPARVLYNWLLGPGGQKLAESQGYVPAAEPQESGPAVAEHWEILEESERLPAVGTRLKDGPMEELIPSADYGALAPFAGAAYYLSGYDGALADDFPNYLYGLMTLDGCAVLDPVCDSISQLSWLDGDGQDQWLPVWKLARSGPDGDPMEGALSALAALDGSWSTPFQYWGAAGSPVGIFAGDEENLYLLDSGSGAEKTRWSWEKLGITQPENFPWFTGDAYFTAQWRDSLFYLGSWGENYDARLLDPETGEVTVITDQAWVERLDAALQNRDADWWEVTPGEDGSVTVSKGAEVYTFQSPLPGESYPYEMDGRVLFRDYGSGSFAVTTWEGELVLPAQKGELNTLETEDGKYLAVQKTPDGDWQLYDWDGNPGVLLPGGTESWCRTDGPLVEVHSRDNAAYYWPDTGACVFRAWFSLEERPGALLQ